MVKLTNVSNVRIESTQGEPDRRDDPMVLVIDTDTVEDHTQRSADESGNHSRETMLWFSDTAVALGEIIGDFIGKVPAEGNCANRPDNSGKIAQSGLPASKA